MPRGHQEPVALRAHSLVLFERKIDARLTVPVRALTQESEGARTVKRADDFPNPLIDFPEERLVLDQSPLLLVHPSEVTRTRGRRRSADVPQKQGR